MHVELWHKGYRCFSSLSHALTLLLKPHPVRTAGSWEVEPLLPLIAESAISRILRHFFVLTICPDSLPIRMGLELSSDLYCLLWKRTQSITSILITFNFDPVFLPGGIWTHPSWPSNQSPPNPSRQSIRAPLVEFEMSHVAFTQESQHTGLSSTLLNPFSWFLA